MAALRRASLEDPPWVEAAAAIAVVTADLKVASAEFADQRPYGERGLRYAFIEAGACAQNIQLQAVEEELSSVIVGGFRDEAVIDALELPPPCAPIALVCLGHPAS